MEKVNLTPISTSSAAPMRDYLAEHDHATTSNPTEIGNHTSLKGARTNIGVADHHAPTKSSVGNLGHSEPKVEPRYIDIHFAGRCGESCVPDTARMVTVAEAARMIERSVSTLARWRKSRSGPSFLKWPGRYGAVRYNEADIIAWCHHRDHARSVH